VIKNTLTMKGIVDEREMRMFLLARENDGEKWDHLDPYDGHYFTVPKEGELVELLRGVDAFTQRRDEKRKKTEAEEEKYLSAKDLKLSTVFSRDKLKIYMEALKKEEKTADSSMSLVADCGVVASISREAGAGGEGEMNGGKKFDWIKGVPPYFTEGLAPSITAHETDTLKLLRYKQELATYNAGDKNGDEPEKPVVLRKFDYTFLKKVHKQRLPKCEEHVLRIPKRSSADSARMGAGGELALKEVERKIEEIRPVVEAHHKGINGLAAMATHIAAIAASLDVPLDPDMRTPFPVKREPLAEDELRTALTDIMEDVKVLTMVHEAEILAQGDEVIAMSRRLRGSVLQEPAAQSSKKMPAPEIVQPAALAAENKYSLQQMGFMANPSGEGSSGGGDDSNTVLAAFMMQQQQMMQQDSRPLGKGPIRGGAQGGAAAAASARQQQQQREISRLKQQLAKANASPRRDARACSKCHQLGHFRRECPNKRPADDTGNANTSAKAARRGGRGGGRGHRGGGRGHRGGGRGGRK